MVVCHFHFYPAVLRSFYQLRYKREFKAATTDPTTGVKTFDAGIGAQHIRSHLVDNLPSPLRVHEIMSYLERTWIWRINGRQTRCPPSFCNNCVRAEIKLHRTDNSCETFNKTVSIFVGHYNPTVYNFVAAGLLEHSSADVKIRSYEIKLQPPKSNRRYDE